MPILQPHESKSLLSDVISNSGSCIILCASTLVQALPTMATRFAALTAKSSRWTARGICDDDKNFSVSLSPCDRSESSPIWRLTEDRVRWTTGDRFRIA
jgi:hypothetical protein